MLAKCLFLSLLLVALPMSLAAQKQSLVFEVPFEFVAFDTVFAAGEYTTSIAIDWYMRFQNRATGRSGYVQYRQGAGAKAGEPESLVFEKVKNLYILRGYRSGERQVEYTVPLAKKRREMVEVLISEGFRAEPVLISAMR